MKTYQVDLDYESYLFDPHYNETLPLFQKTNREFEYVFFLINKEKCALKNIRSYDKNYLNTLQALGFVIPELHPNEARSIKWWGHHHDKELEKKLNSKLTSSRLAKQRGWGFHEGAIVSSVSEVYEHLRKFPKKERWIIKRPHSFSGIGHYQFSASEINEETLKKILVEEVLLEPLYKRIFDVGVTFVVSEGAIIREFMVENLNSPNGGFKGGIGSSNVDKFKKYILEKYRYSLDDLEKKIREIATAYLSMGASSNIQIDSFVYEEEGELKLYPLVEVNYRKTMGLVIQSLADKHPDASFIEWRILNAKEVTEKMKDWIKLSPEGNHFRSFYKTF